MAQLVSGSDGSRLTPDVLTDADPLIHNIPAPRAPEDPLNASMISVGSLLRREGRAPHSMDRPVRPRTHQQQAAQHQAAQHQAAQQQAAQQQAPEPGSGSRIRGVVVRRAAVAAGTLLAAGSVFGAAVLINPFAGYDAPEALDGSAPGQGVLDGDSAAAGALPGPRPLGPTTSAGFQGDGGEPFSLLPAAFPTAFDAATPSGAEVAPGTGAAGDAAPGAVPAGAGTPAGPTPSGTAPSQTAPAPSGPLEPAVSTVRKPVGQVTGAVGAAAPEPLRAPVSSLDGTVESGAEPVTRSRGGGEPETDRSADREAQEPALSSLDSSDEGPRSDGPPDSVGRTAAGLLD